MLSASGSYGADPAKPDEHQLSLPQEPQPPPQPQQEEAKAAVTLVGGAGVLTQQGGGLSPGQQHEQAGDVERQDEQGELGRDREKAAARGEQSAAPATVAAEHAQSLTTGDRQNAQRKDECTDAMPVIADQNQKPGVGFSAPAEVGAS